jgi:hypothetical protein
VLLLSDEDLHRFAIAVEESSPQHIPQLYWSGWPSVRMQDLASLREVKRILGRAASDEFGRLCKRFTEPLMTNLRLDIAIETVREWLWEVRHFLRETGQASFLPERERIAKSKTRDFEGAGGSYPTPSSIWGGNASKSYVGRLRKALGASPALREADHAAIAAAISEPVGTLRGALHFLSRVGELAVAPSCPKPLRSNQRPLSPDTIAAKCLIALSELRATTPQTSCKRAEILKRAEGQSTDPTSYGYAFADLQRRGLAKSARGCSGGFWLTSRGGLEAVRLNQERHATSAQ